MGKEDSTKPAAAAEPGSDTAGEIPPSVMAISNLRCPSPPPILTNSKRNSTTSPPTLAPTPKIAEPGVSSSTASIASAGRPTIPSGGAVLNEEKKKDKDKDIKLHLPVGLDYVANPPLSNSHHKAPSVHAHFYVDETVKLKGNRSRSGSGSATGSEYSGPSLASKNVGSLEKLVSTTSSPVLNNAGTGEQNTNIDPRLPQDDGKLHVLLGACGGFSAPKLKLIILKLLEIYGPEKISIQIILTKASENFIAHETLNYLENVRKFRIWRDSDEWTTWKTRSDPVLHIELRRWADILIVCPLTANTLSKICLGLCDNLLTNVIRAWNTSYPILLAPAMVSYTYNSIITKRQLRLIAEEMPWIEILKPVEKVVGSYGEIGMGGMMDYNEIVNKIVVKLGGYPEDDDDEEEDDKKNVDQTLPDDDDSDDDDDDDDDDEEAIEDDDCNIVEAAEGLRNLRAADLTK